MDSTGLLVARIPAVRRELLEQLSSQVVAQYGHGRAALAIDGRSGTGKTGLADDLSLVLRDRGVAVLRASLDDFHFPRAHRYRRGRYSPEGYYEDSFDYATFRRVLLDPWRMRTGAGVSVRSFDLARDAPVESQWTTAPDDAVLVVDGVFAQRPELRGAWNWTCYLEAPLLTGIERASRRAGISDDPESPDWRRYLGAWDLYERNATPRASASVIVDTWDLDAPVRVYADSC